MSVKIRTFTGPKMLNMRSIFLLLTAFFAMSYNKAGATDGWQVFFNKQEIFKGNAEMEQLKTTFKSRELKKNDCFRITYNNDHPYAGWKRTFYFNDSTDNTIKTLELNKQTGSVSLNASVLKEMMIKKQPVFIYTVSLPKDPDKASNIRVRRILLCKIEWN